MEKVSTVKNKKVKLSPAGRRERYRQLVDRDGEKCKKCGIRPPDAKLEIHKIKPSLGYDSLDNLELLCRRCNVKVGPKRGKAKKKTGEDSGDNVLERPRIFSAEFLRSQDTEPRFRTTVYKLMREHGTLSADDLVDAASEAAGCSISTGFRYLRKLVSLLGSFKLDENKVVHWRDNEDSAVKPTNGKGIPQTNEAGGAE